VNLLSITVERCLLLDRLSEAELVKRSEEFKTALLSSVSHDMRTPLSAISASASSLSRFGAELNGEMRSDLLNTIEEQCERLNRYTTNLLNLGRLQAGVDHRQFTECDALEVLGAAISRTRTLGSSHAITKQYDIAAAPVRADPVMLEQVFYNVLENAVRYSPEGSCITVSATTADHHLAVSITDSGEGILASDLTLVFERFFRSRTSLPHDGSGLGLSIAKGFAEAFGGSIEAARADERRGGTTIRIRLPLEPTKAASS
jgi:two-component system sensor histidine kinase KdpD